MPSPKPGHADASERVVLSARPALIVAVAGIVIAIVGFFVAGPPLSVTGTGLVALAGLAPLWVRGVGAGIALSARPLHATVIEGRAVRLEVRIGGARPLGLAGARLAHELLEEPLELTGALTPERRPDDAARRLRARRRAGTVVLTAPARGRGRLVLGPPHLLLADPLSLVSGRRAGAGPAGELLILPRTEAVHWFDVDTRRAAGELAVGVAGTQAIDVAGLRDYQPGTPATRIHWPAAARGGELLERVYASESELAPVVVVDPRCDDPVKDREVVDAVVRAAASLAWALAHAGAVDLLLAGHTTPLRITSSLAGWPLAHQALALLPGAPRSAPPPHLPVGGDGLLFYACSDPALAAAAEHRWGGRLLTLSPAPAEGGVPGAVLEVAGCVALRSRSGT